MLRISNLGNAFLGPVMLDVAAGECVAIRGASGAGKSVFLRAIADLDPNDGLVTWQNRNRADVPAPEWRRLIGYVPAETGWWADGVADHFPTGTDVGGQFGSVGLPADALDWDVARLSTGERHRLGLLRALMLQPQVILLDEPTAALDGEATAQIEHFLAGHIRRGAAVVVVTHDPAQARRLASRTLIMAAGKLTAVQDDTAAP